jgi:hypothetical protein
MAFPWPSIDTIKAAWITIHKAARPSADDAFGSDLWLASRIMSRVISRLHQTGERVLNALFPTTTFGDYLTSWLRFVGAPDGLGGYGRVLARGSTGTDALAIVSTGAGPWADQYHQQLTDAAGLVYQVTEHYTPAGATTYNADVESVSTGTATNLESGTTLTFSSPSAGITAAAVLVANLDYGADLESDAEGLSRLAAWLRDPPASGNVADWVDAINSAAPGQLRPYVWLERQNYPTGWGLVDYAAMEVDEFGAAQHVNPTSDLGLSIIAAVAARLPVLLMKNSRMITLVAAVANAVEISLTMSDWAEESDLCDWDAETPQWTVDAATKATLLVNVSAATTATYLTVGDRVIIDGAQAIVTHVGVAGGVAADEFKVDAWFDTYDADKNPYPWHDATHGVSLHCYSGGGKIMAVYAALREYLGKIGPSKDSGTGADAISDWDDTIRVNAILSCAIVAGGGKVVDVTVAEPAADWAPAALYSTTANRVFPHEVTIWEIK